MSRLRLLHLVTHPIQYFAPLYRELASCSEIELRVLFGSQKGAAAFFDEGFGQVFAWDIPLLDGYDYAFLSESHGELDAADMATALSRLVGVLRESWDCIWVHGYTVPLSLVALVLARSLSLPVIVRDEANLLQPRPAWRQAAKAPLLRWLATWAHACYIGRNNWRFWRHYGVGSEHLHFAPYSVENTFFRARARELQPLKQQLRVEFGLPSEAPVVLMVSKLQAQKNPMMLLDAFAEIQRQVPASLLFAGDGNLRGDLEAAIHRRKIANCCITGFLNQSQIGRAYAAADVLVLPSNAEPWGLVVNEAMNFGLPIIVSDQVGCASDLVLPGRNGYIVPKGDYLALAKSLVDLLTDENKRSSYSRQSSSLIESYSVQRTADGILEGALASISRSRSR